MFRGFANEFPDRSSEPFRIWARLRKSVRGYEKYGKFSTPFSNTFKIETECVIKTLLTTRISYSLLVSRNEFPNRNSKFLQSPPESIRSASTVRIPSHPIISSSENHLFNFIQSVHSPSVIRSFSEHHFRTPYRMESKEFWSFDLKIHAWNYNMQTIRILCRKQSLGILFS